MRSTDYSCVDDYHAANDSNQCYPPFEVNGDLIKVGDLM